MVHMVAQLRIVLSCAFAICSCNSGGLRVSTVRDAGSTGGNAPLVGSGGSTGTGGTTSATTAPSAGGSLGLTTSPGTQPGAGGMTGAGGTTTSTSTGTTTLSSASVLVNLDDQPVSILTMGGKVYIGLFLGGIVSVPSTGGTTSPVVSLAGAPDTFLEVPFVTDQTSFFWAEVSIGSNGGPLAKAPVGGGIATVLTTTGGYATGVLADSNNVYWVDQDHGTLSRIPAAGGMVTTIASGLTTPGGLALHGGTLYLSDAAGDLLSVPTNGGTVTTLFTGPGLPPNTSVAMYTPPIITDGTNVYFSVCYVNQGIYKFPLDRSGPATVLGSPSGNTCASGLAADGDHLYWADDWSVSAVSLVDGSTQVVWNLDTSIGGSISGGPALDDANVYWGVTPQAGTCGLCPPPPQGQINAVLRAPKLSK